MEIKDDGKKVEIIIHKLVIEIANNFTKHVAGDSSGGANKNYGCDNSQKNNEKPIKDNDDDMVCIPKRRFHRTKLTATVTAYVVSIGSLIVLFIEFINAIMK